MRFSFVRECVFVGLILVSGGLGIELWAASLGAVVETWRWALALGFVGLVGTLMVAGLRLGATSSNYNYAVALQSWNAGDRDRAFLVLFDPARPLAPSFLKRKDVQQLLRKSLANALAQTAVVEIKTDRRVVGFLAALDKAIGPEKAAGEVSSSEEAEAHLAQAMSQQALLRRILAWTAVVGALMSLIKLFASR